MQLLGLILLIATSWYIWKLSSNFFDDQTKREISDNYGIFQEQFNELKKRFSKENLNKVWDKYKEDSSPKDKDK
tara:strand:- start:1608 stop:1829 length:222 start_codon:yes stop_codon:yes gene_type:complete